MLSRYVMRWRNSDEMAKTLLSCKRMKALMVASMSNKRMAAFERNRQSNLATEKLKAKFKTQ
jgi:hypothetical protein